MKLKTIEASSDRFRLFSSLTASVGFMRTQPSVHWMGIVLRNAMWRSRLQKRETWCVYMFRGKIFEKNITISEYSLRFRLLGK